MPPVSRRRPRTHACPRYVPPLLGSHFRLLYLSGSRTIDGPVHGNLVEYERENCPEYETTSYTWGGEDGDATPCRPAYFGDFWDVLFLTRNCWSMLQYLRPQMGTRVVWVDAICINQNNIQERGAQVSSMPQIYRNCMRVVIYPGDHLVRKEEHRFRQRIRYDEMIKDGDILPVDNSDLDIWNSVLQSRYISRVWIIQELILAPRAILALKHHDVYPDHNLLHTISWGDDRRDWLEYMEEKSPLRKTTLYQWLRRTCDSQATDPRDKIFGILGILGADPMYSEIVPDYSLSMRDCVIGAMGLTLINSKEIWPLLHAQNSGTTPGYPSWVPSLDEFETWTDENLRQRGVIPPHNVRGEWASAIGLERAHAMSTRIPDPDDMRRPVLMLGSDMPWCQDASIDSGSGALTLRLVRVFDRPHKILERKEQWGQRYFLVEGPSAAAWFTSTRLPQKPEQPCHVFLACHSHNLETDPSPLRTSDIYLVFAAEAEASGTFNLVSCFHLGDAMLLSASPTSLPLLSKVGSVFDGEKVCSVPSLFKTLHQTLNYNPRKHYLPDLECETEAFGERHPWDADEGDISEDMLLDIIVPGNGAAASDFLQLSLTIARMGEPARVTEEFSRAYDACLQSVSADFNPLLDDEYVWFTLVDNDALGRYWDSVIRHLSHVLIDHSGDQWRPWDAIFPSWFDLQIPEIGKTPFDGPACNRRPGGGYEGPGPIRCTIHQDYEPQGHMRLHYWLPCTEEPRELQMPVRARMPLMKVVKAIRATELNRLHRRLLAFSEKVSEDVDALLERGPRPEDSSVYLEDWPKSLVDELGFVWRNELVTFV